MTCVVISDLARYEAEEERQEKYEEWALDQEQEFSELLKAYMEAPTYFTDQTAAAKLRAFVDHLIKSKHD